MSWIGGVLRRAQETFHRGRARDELEEEIRFHLERDIERLEARGLSPDEARREAVRRFGSVPRVREDTREEAGFRWLEQTARDARHAGRRLRSAPGFTVAAVLTIGLGIGATTAIYSVVDAVLLRPLPYPRPDRLVRIVQQNSPENRWNLSVADLEGVRERATAFASVAALRAGSSALTGRGRPERIPTGWVTADWFRVLGVEPAVGRGFAAGEDGPGSPGVVVISAALRDRLFGPGEDPLGAALTLDGQPYEIIGVLSPGRRDLGGYEADAWPILRLETPGRRGPFFLRGFARLDPGTTFAGARRDLARVSEEIYPLWADGFSDRSAVLTPYALQDMVVGDAGDVLWLLMGAVGGILLIGIANVANLLLFRGSGREREMALRASLGASRGRLARQLLTESLLLASLGGVVGLAIARVGLRAFVVSNPGLPRAAEISLDAGVLGFAAVATLSAGLLFGLAPLLQATSKRSMAGLREGEGRGTDGKAWVRLRSALVAAEFAIALPLLAGASLLFASLGRLQRVDPGYDPENVLTAGVSLPEAAYEGPPELLAFWDEALRRIEAIPGVARAGVSTGLPPDFAGNTNNFDLADRPVAPGESEHSSVWGWTSAGYLEALGVPLLEGRLIEPTDDGNGPLVVLVSRSWADRFYPDGGALGARLYAGGDHVNAMSVVGIVGDVKYRGLSAADDAAVYEPYGQAGFRSVSLVVRFEGSSSDALDRVRAAIASLDPDLPLSDVRLMSDRMDAATAAPRYWSTILGLFAGLGLLLAAIGVYGVLSYHVSRRTRDIGIRMALGASPWSVRWLVVRQGIGRALAGIAIGLGASLLLTRSIESLLFGVSGRDPRVLLGTAAILGLVALVASYLPARRATRLDPLRALREE